MKNWKMRIGVLNISIHHFLKFQKESIFLFVFRDIGAVCLIDDSPKYIHRAYQSVLIFNNIWINFFIFWKWIKKRIWSVLCSETILGISGRCTIWLNLLRRRMNLNRICTRWSQERTIGLKFLYFLSFTSDIISYLRFFQCWLKFALINLC